MQQEHIDARYEFSEEEKNAMAKQVTEKEIKVAAIEEEKKSAVEGFNQQIKDLNTEILYLSRCVQDGSEIRTYKCRLEKDSVRQLRIWRDIETEKVIKEEPFTPEDFQGELSV